MTDLWTDFLAFVRDPINREILTWLGGGVVVIVGGVWTAFTFLRKRPAKPSPSGAQQAGRITAERIAAGGNLSAQNKAGGDVAVKRARAEGNVTLGVESPGDDSDPKA